MSFNQGALEFARGPTTLRVAASRFGRAPLPPRGRQLVDPLQVGGSGWGG